MKKAWLGAGLALLVAAAVLVFRSRLPTMRGVPKAPVPVAFPDCPPSGGAPTEWKALSFLVPEGWRLEQPHPDAGKTPGRRGVFLRRGDDSLLDFLQSISIASDSSIEYRQLLDLAYSSAPAAVSSHIIPGTARTLEVDGRKSVLYASRYISQGAEHDDWVLWIDGGKTVYEISSPMAFTPYQLKDGLIYHSKERQADNDRLFCAYWSVVRSLRIR